MKRRYPGSAIVYVAAARLPARDQATQAALHRLELEICRKWGVPVADVFAALDLTTGTNRSVYSFDSLQPSGLPDTALTKHDWTDGKGVRRPTGTHPNFPAMERFYVPIVAATLRASAARGR